MRSSKSRFSRMRKGGGNTRRPRIVIPLGPGPMAATRDAQVQMMQPVNGSLGTNIIAKWAFVLTPEKLDFGGQEASPMYAATDLEENGLARVVRARRRIVGFSGNLTYTPLDVLLEGADMPTSALAGLVGWAWFKIESLGAPNTDEEPGYLFGNFEEATAYLNIQGRGFTPNLVMADVSAPVELENRDWRAKNMKLISSGYKHWRLPGDVVSDSTGGFAGRYAAGCGNPVQIPLPRKLVCDVGRGEALAMVLWHRDFTQSSETGGAPNARLDYPDMRVKVVDLD